MYLSLFSSLCTKNILPISIYMYPYPHVFIHSFLYLCTHRYKNFKCMCRPSALCSVWALYTVRTPHCVCVFICCVAMAAPTAHYKCSCVQTQREGGLFWSTHDTRAPLCIWLRVSLHTCHIHTPTPLGTWTYLQLNLYSFTYTCTSVCRATSMFVCKQEDIHSDIYLWNNKNICVCEYTHTYTISV